MPIEDTVSIGALNTSKHEWQWLAKLSVMYHCEQCGSIWEIAD